MFSVSFSVQKSITVDCELSKSFAVLADFAHWPCWSPWLRQEPTCQPSIDGQAATIGHSQSWDGELIGAGTISIVDLKDNISIDHQLQFLKPWKNTSKSGFRLASVAGGTEIEWWMQGNLPFYMFFLQKMMSAMIGSDYGRGLIMLKEYLETGKVSGSDKVMDVSWHKPRYYLGKRRKCSMAELAKFMPEDFAQMQSLRASSALAEPLDISSIYHHHDLVSGMCEYSAAFLYDQPQPASAGLAAGEIPAHNALQVEHLGAYRYLGNGWAMAMAYARTKHKLNKKIPIYEIYSNDPQQVPETELQTQIYVPVQ